MTLRATATNLGSPGTIGGTTPGAITGTTITATEKFVATGGTVTADAPPYSATQTWNNGAITFTGYKLNITDTASAAGSLLMDLQVGGVSKISGTKAGTLRVGDGSASAPSYSFGSDTNIGLFRNAEDQLGMASGGIAVAGPTSNGEFQFRDVAIIGWSSGDWAAAASDLVLRRDAANTLAQRNGTNAQIRNSYNTFTNSTNYERLTEVWSSNICYHKTEAAGTGTLRQYIPVTNGVAVASLPSAATAGMGARSFVTDANATTFASVVAGGGANKVPVYSDGTNWLIG